MHLAVQQESLATASEEADLKHRRRALTDEEFDKLISATRNGPRLKGFDGAIRS